MWIKRKLNENNELFSFLARLYESTGRAIAVTPASALASESALLKMLKFLNQVFYESISLELVYGSS